MTVVLEFVFYFLLTCIVYLGVSFCPNCIRTYLIERDRLRVWIFIPLILSSVFIVFTSAIAYVYLLERIIDYEFQHRSSFAAGSLLSVYFMIWVNAKKFKSKKD